MSNYIKREEAIESVKDTYAYFTGCGGEHFAHRALDDITSADVIERKRGEWEFLRDGVIRCSICEYTARPWQDTHFCPNCGADMRGTNNA